VDQPVAAIRAALIDGPVVRRSPASPRWQFGSWRWASRQ
jgi:hypothetical protein